jgi:tRNA-dihydrouridine synthase
MTDFMDRHFKYLTQGKKEYTEAEVRMIIDGAIQEGMKREHAMWVLANIEDVHAVNMLAERVQKLEENEHEYCDHGIYINYHCKSCECIEQADMRSEME